MEELERRIQQLQRANTQPESTASAFYDQYSKHKPTEKQQKMIKAELELTSEVSEQNDAPSFENSITALEEKLIRKKQQVDGHMNAKYNLCSKQPQCEFKSEYAK